MISGGRAARDILGWMIVLYYDVGNEESVRMYASNMQPRCQLCIERRITLPLSLYSAFARKEGNPHPPQAMPIYLTNTSAVHAHPYHKLLHDTVLRTPDPITRPPSSPGTSEGSDHTNKAPPTVLEPHAPQTPQPRISRNQSTPTTAQSMG